MNKRHFLKSGLALGATALAAPLATPVLAQDSRYSVIDPPLNTRVSDKIEVIEYFWFGCPHCFAFEPAINAWKDNDKPDYVEFVREAPPLNPSWEPHSRAFYASELLKVGDKFFDQMFNGIHADRRALRSPKQIGEFAGEQGIDEKKFLKAMDSFAATTRMNAAMQMAVASGIRGVPSIVINGKYMTGGSLAGSHANIIAVIDELAAKEHELMQAG